MAAAITSDFALGPGEKYTPWSASVLGTDLVAGSKTGVYSIRASKVPGFLVVDYSFNAAPTAINLIVEVNEGGNIWTTLKTLTNVNGDTFIFPAFAGNLRVTLVSLTGTSATTLNIQQIQALPGVTINPTTDATFNLGSNTNRYLEMISTIFSVVSPKLAKAQLVVAEEEITLATGAATSDSVANLLPANSIILAVNSLITVTITTSANWKVGDANVADRFRLSNSTMTAGQATVGLEQWSVRLTEGTPNVITTNTGYVQTAAAKVRITLNANPGAGKIRVTVFALQFTVAAS